MITYTVVIPIMAFVVDAMQNGLSPSSFDGKKDSAEIHDSGETSKITGTLLMFYGIGLLIGSPILGYMGDRMTGRKWPMMFGILALFLSTFLFLYGTQLWFFAAARFLQGLSNACIWILGICVLVDNFPQRVLGKVMSIVSVANTIGLSTGSPIGALTATDLLLRLILVERRNSPKEWFESSLKGDYNETLQEYTPPSGIEKEATRKQICQSLSSTFNNFSCEKTNETVQKAEKSIYISEDDDNDIKLQTDNNNKNKINQQQGFKMTRLLLYPRFLTAVYIYFLSGMSYNIFEPTLTVHLAHEWNYNSSQIGLIFLAQNIFKLIAAPISGIVYDRYGPKWFTFVTMLLCGISIIGMGIPNHDTEGGIIPLVFALVLVGSFTVAFTVPSLPEIAHCVTQINNGSNDGHARSYGLYTAVFGLGAFCGPLLGGFLYDRIGFLWLCIVIAFVMFLSAPIALIFTGERKITLSKTTSKCTS
ncbi:major facilitator superfamily domain-containing protein [Circinella umbellata]|nr:major facilitator superfamily domain-containing protein [Circinella umbellata]